MASLWEEHRRQELITRLDRLTPEASRRWGKLKDCPAMLAHVNDALRMPLGDVTPAPKKMALRYFPLKQLIIHVLPFPRGAPTAPVLLARCETAVFAEEVQAFRELLGRLAQRADQTTWPAHPAFGSMSHRDWGVLGYRHTDHHFSQFGV